MKAFSTTMCMAKTNMSKNVDLKTSLVDYINLHWPEGMYTLEFTPGDF